MASHCDKHCISSRVNVFAMGITLLGFYEVGQAVAKPCRLQLCAVVGGSDLQFFKKWAIIRRAVKKFLEFPCRRRMRDKIAHAVMWWEA
jgi:hypothetical protein